MRKHITPDQCRGEVVLLDPNSMFMRRWDIVMLVCLLYVASVSSFSLDPTAI